MGEHEILLISAAIGFSGISNYAIRPEMVDMIAASSSFLPDTLSAGVNINNHIYGRRPIIHIYNNSYCFQGGEESGGVVSGHKYRTAVAVTYYR